MPTTNEETKQASEKKMFDWYNIASPNDEIESSTPKKQSDTKQKTSIFQVVIYFGVLVCVLMFFFLCLSLSVRS